MSERITSQPLPNGYFPIRIIVRTGLSERFIEDSMQRHKIIIIQAPKPTGNQYEEAIIAVPFADKEMLRIDFNIFASEMETRYGRNMEFRMESAEI